MTAEKNRLGAILGHGDVPSYWMAQSNTFPRFSWTVGRGNSEIAFFLVKEDAALFLAAKRV